LIFDHVFSRTSDKKRLKKMLRRMRKLPQRLAARFREG
jgi:hypothetical protein